MSSWFSTTVSIDEQVEKATSESLPTGEQDLGLNLEICDLIRSKTVQPKDAMRSLKRRLLHKNPNVKINTMHLIDTCIKNGGSHFLQEIASREFMDTAMLVLKPPSGVINREVQQVMLEYIQNWANAFDGQIQLSYVNKIYNQLRSEGFKFPETSKLGSSFIDSSAPPEWVDSDTCMKSGTPFSFYNRKHHCRNCGGVYIQNHCSNYIPLPHFGINTAVRVCDDCYGSLESKKRVPSQRSSRERRRSSTVKYEPSPAASQHNEHEDEDLKRALQLSLEESKTRGAPPAPAPVTAATTTTTTIEEEDDEDMKAAIAASLQDMEDQKKQKASNGLYSHSNVEQTSQPYEAYYQQQQQQQHNQPSTPPPNVQPVENPDEFTPLEEEILYRYIQLVEGLQQAPNGAILKDTKLQQLNDSVSALRPKLARTLGSTIDKYDTLVDMHSKLTTVVRFYDKILEDRLSRTTSIRSPMSPQHSGYYQPAQAPPVNSQTHPSYANAMSPSAPSAPSAPPLAAAVPPPTAPNANADSWYPEIQSPTQAQPQQGQQQQKPKQDEILIEL